MLFISLLKFSLNKIKLDTSILLSFSSVFFVMFFNIIVFFSCFDLSNSNLDKKQLCSELPLFLLELVTAWRASGTTGVDVLLCTELILKKLNIVQLFSLIETFFLPKWICDVPLPFFLILGGYFLT